ncbi:MAG TPA: DUF1588 domain-containing protein [Myxococcota bacterium]
MSTNAGIIHAIARAGRFVAAFVAFVAFVALVVIGGCTFGPGIDRTPSSTSTPPPLPHNGDPLTTALASEARRLTQGEIDRTLRDVLVEPSQAGTRLLGTDKFTPYDNDYTTQASSSALADSLEGLSIDVTTRALASPDSRAVIIPCTPSAPDDAACFDQVVRTVGKRMLRRPLSDDEVATYHAFLPFAVEQSPFYTTSFDTAVELALRAFLMDPEFLFRIEVGTPTGEDGVVQLSAYEIATRMSYFLWASAPDDALYADADAGHLDDADARRTVAERMLSDEKAKEQMARFHAMWLGYRAIPTPADVAVLFSQETNALLDRVIFDEKRDYLDVFTFDQTFVDDSLADLYGLPHPATSPGWVSYDGTDRAGILSQGAVLASFSKFTDTSPTQRGILVRNRLLCLPILPPPPTVNVDQPPAPDGSIVCKKDRYLAHTASTSCNSCHSQMDPIGFGLENYDIEGRFRTHDDGLPDCAIDGNGELPGYGTFHGPKELAQKLVDNSLVGPCFVQQLTSFENGRPLTSDEQSVVSAWDESFESGDATTVRRLDQLLLAKVTGTQFVSKREPTTSSTGVSP